jgi:hypothetical protein
MPPTSNQIKPVPNFYALLGAAYVDQNNIADAIELLTPIQQQNPENFEIRRALDAAIKGQQVQQALDAAPKTYNPPPSAPIFRTRTKVFMLSIFLGFVFFAFASQAGVGHETAIFTLGTAGIFCFIIAFLARPRFREQ